MTYDAAVLTDRSPLPDDEFRTEPAPAHSLGRQKNEENY